MGLMPVVTSESAAYGYDAEDRHFVRVFLGREAPLLTFDDGLEVVKLLMTAYKSAEEGKTLDFPPAGIGRVVPAVGKGSWKPIRKRGTRKRGIGTALPLPAPHSTHSIPR